MARFGKIIATGIFVPPNEVTNDALRARVTNPIAIDKLEANSCIKTRWYADESATTSDLIVPAAKQALARAGLKATDLDLIIVGTDTPDFLTPATSIVVQHKLAAKKAGAFDVGCACASFPTSLSIASGILATNPAINNILVVGAYLMHKLADPKDPVTFFYGDAAGCAILTADAKPGFITAAYQADGTYHNFWGIFAGGTKEPTTIAAVEAGRTQVKMLDRYPPEINEQGWPSLVRTLAAQGNFSVTDIDFVIFTQVRKPTILKVMDDLGLPHDKTHVVMEKWGYTGSACIPLALDDALTQNKIKSGDLVVLIGSGVGYTQAACAFYWS